MEIISKGQCGEIEMYMSEDSDFYENWPNHIIWVNGFSLNVVSNHISFQFSVAVWLGLGKDDIWLGIGKHGLG